MCDIFLENNPGAIVFLVPSSGTHFKEPSADLQLHKRTNRILYEGHSKFSLAISTFICGYSISGF
jgi:hypothetical protein